MFRCRVSTCTMVSRTNATTHYVLPRLRLVPPLWCLRAPDFSLFFSIVSRMYSFYYPVLGLIASNPTWTSWPCSSLHQQGDLTNPCRVGHVIFKGWRGRMRDISSINQHRHRSKEAFCCRNLRYSVNKHFQPVQGYLIYSPTKPSYEENQFPFSFASIYQGPNR